MKTSKILNGLAVAAASIFLYGCTDEPAVSPSEDEELEITQLSTSQAAAVEVELQALDDIIMENEVGRTAAGCAVITRNPVNKTIVVDFGSGCTGPFGRERAGRIRITYGGVFGDQLANRVITFENHFVNNRQITGTIELRDFNLDQDGNPTLTRKHTNLRMIFSNGNHFTSNGNITISWISGFGDEDPLNNRFQITGSYEGESSRGRKVVRKITEPLEVDFNCLAEGGFPIVSGTIELSTTGMNGERTRLVEYGDGTCDNTITVTINGKVYPVNPA